MQAKDTYMNMKDEQYWQELLSNDIQELNIVGGCPGKWEKQKKKIPMQFSLGQEITDHLLKVCKNQELLLYIYLQTAFRVFLYKLTGMKDICIAVPILSQGPITENRVVLVRNDIEPKMTYRELLNAVKKATLIGYTHQAYSMDQALKDTKCDMKMRNFMRYSIMMNGIHNCVGEDLLVDYESDMILSITIDGKLLISIYYNTERVTQQFLHGFCSAYQYIIRQTTQNMDINIFDIELADKTELMKLKAWNQTFSNYNIDKTVDQYFQVAVKLYENRKVLTSIKQINGEIYRETLQYGQVNKKSQMLAQILTENGINRGDAVGVFMRNSNEIVIAMMSILMAGGVFVPLDMEYPKERIYEIAKDSSMKLILTNLDIAFNRDRNIHVIHIDEIDMDGRIEKKISMERCVNDTAYIIYTSGTTGVPKGVKVSHKSFLNFIFWRMKTYSYTENEVSLQLISPAFDGALTNIFPILLSGGRCIYVDNHLWRNIAFINELIYEEKVTNFSIVPSMYQLMVEKAEVESWESLRFIVLAGEAAGSTLIDFGKEKFPHIQMINEYGPTETTITAAAKLDMNSLEAECIGRPIANTSIYILNNDENVLPAGFAGELCISGEGVSTGYVGLEEENKKKFIDDPFENGKRMYKTGDIALWSEEGQLIYLGRKDRQVKLHGLRIELDEIENALCTMGNIRNAHVWINEEKNIPEILAVVEGQTKLDMNILKSHLKNRLPNYMIPAKIQFFQQFPVNLRGKLDLEVLENAFDEQKEFTQSQPLDEVEQFFWDLWKTLLLDANFDLDSKFFDVGGNSMLIMMMHNEVEKKYPKLLTIPDYFTSSTIRQLAKMVNNRMK